jgi:two-component system alkaline phosphatase synthesis response regulator PhoP
VIRKLILIIDDEPEIRELLAEGLSAHYQILFAKNGQEGIDIALKNKVSLIILDILMPGMTGIETCQKLREHNETSAIPIIMLTAFDDSKQKTEAFRAGADDYITKPFDFEELLARVQSKIKRMVPVEVGPTHLIKYGDLVLNFQKLNAEINDQDLELGQIEFKILNSLIKNRGEVVERDILQIDVWGAESPSDRALDPHITSLRRKLKNSRHELKTFYGQGYSLVLKEK